MMDNEKLEARIRRLAEHTAPEQLTGILEACEARKGNVMNGLNSLFYLYSHSFSLHQPLAYVERLRNMRSYRDNDRDCMGSVT